MHWRICRKAERKMAVLLPKLTRGQPPNTLGNRALPLIQIAKLLDISASTFTIQELEDAIKSLRGNKAPGLDNIPSLIWKDPLFHDLLLRFCNHTFSSLRPPSAWTKSGIVPIPKKGDLTLPLNYRGISLIPIAAKIYNKLLLNRLVPAVDPLLRNNQNGFRGGRSTISQILALRRIIEEMKRLDKDFTICFVDFRKTFNSINREVMFNILPLYGIPQPIIAAIKALYTHTQASVITPDGETDFFDIEAGVLQGDTLAPFLFIIVLDYVLRLSLDTINDKGLQIHPRHSRRQPATHITDLDFADDIALVSDLVTNAEALLHSVEDAANLVGLHCNETKTEVISSTPNSSFRSLAGNSIKQVEDFKYLGSFVMNSEKDMKSRKALAWVACNKLNKIWHSTLANETKVYLFKTLIEPILLYGAETWTLTTRQQKRLDTATEPQRKWYIMYYCGGLVAMSVTEASHTQIPSRGMRAWKKQTSLWQWRTARCGGRLWIRSRLPGPPDDDDKGGEAFSSDKEPKGRSWGGRWLLWGGP